MGVQGDGHAIHGERERPDPRLVAGLKGPVLAAELADRDRRTAYLGRLFELLADLVPLDGSPAGQDAACLRVVVTDLPRALRDPSPG